MLKIKELVFFLAFALVLALSLRAYCKVLPPYPSVKTDSTVAAKGSDKARELFELARKENVGLRWDECLARKAAARASAMVRKSYFSHEEPGMDRNPAWNLVSACHQCRCAGENLAKGYQPAPEVHKALMESKTHRENIVNPQFNLMGVGCVDYICVELFAGV